MVYCFCILDTSTVRDRCIVCGRPKAQGRPETDVKERLHAGLEVSTPGGPATITSLEAVRTEIRGSRSKVDHPATVRVRLANGQRRTYYASEVEPL